MFGRRAEGLGASGNYSIAREQLIFTYTQGVNGNIIAENTLNLS